MGELSFEAIRPLIHHREQGEGLARCVFRCPRTGVTALASVPLSGRGVEGLWASLRVWVTGLFAGVFGRAESGTLPEAVVLRAFEQVQGRFHWDGEAWHGNPATKLAAGFQRQLDAAPVAEPGDRDLLARMLVEIACADRDVNPEEEAFLGEILGSSDAVKELSERPKLSASELRCSGDRRPAGETMLMLAWTMAYCDRELALSELNRLNTYAAHMGIPEEVIAELRTHAQELLLERALSVAHHADVWDPIALKEARALASAIGVEPADLERAEAEIAAR